MCLPGTWTPAWAPTRWRRPSAGGPGASPHPLCFPPALPVGKGERRGFGLPAAGSRFGFFWGEVWGGFVLQKASWWVLSPRCGGQTPRDGRRWLQTAFCRGGSRGWAAAALWARSGHCRVTRGWVRELWVLPRGWVTPRGPQGWVGRQLRGSAWCHPQCPRVSLGLSPAVGTQHSPGGGLWGAPAPLLRPTISGEGESQPMAKEGLQTPRPHGLLYPPPPNPSPLGQCELEGQLHSILRGREKEHSGDAPGIGDAAWGGSTPCLGPRCTAP